MTAAPAAGISVLVVAALALYSIWKMRSRRAARRRQGLVTRAREILGALDALNGRNNRMRVERIERNPRLHNPMRNEDEIALSDLRSIEIWNLQDEILKLMNEVRHGSARALDDGAGTLDRLGAAALQLSSALDRGEPHAPAHACERGAHPAAHSGDRHQHRIRPRMNA